MENNETHIAIFNGKAIRKVWFAERWWFVIEDIIKVLTDSSDPKQYIQKLKQRDDMLAEGWVHLVRTLSIQTGGGKQEMNCSDTEAIFRISKDKVRIEKRLEFNITVKRNKKETTIKVASMVILILADNNYFSNIKFINFSKYNWGVGHAPVASMVMHSPDERGPSRHPDSISGRGGPAYCNSEFFECENSERFSFWGDSVPNFFLIKFVKNRI